jgi:hypothetical protein
MTAIPSANGRDVPALVPAILDRVTAWLAGHAHAYRSAHLTENHGRLLLVMVQQSDVYDEELDSSATQLELAIARDDALQASRFDVLVIPPWGDHPESAFISRRLHLRLGTSATVGADA